MLNNILYQMPRRQELMLVCMFAASIFIAAILFWPGISGPFLLDDWVHLPGLAGESEYGFWRFIGSGTQTPGRALSFLSLLIDDVAWPADPEPFKRTNILLHLLNGVLVFVLMRLLISHLRFNRCGEWIALLAAFLWMVHPIQVSTTLYVIQRMTILASTSMLLACIFYVYGRTKLVTRPWVGYTVMSLGVSFWGLVGLGFKETAVVLLLYVWVIEFFVLSSVEVGGRQGKLFKIWISCFIYLPTAFVVGYFLLNIPMLEDMASKRSWSIGERLLTEPRVIFDYIGNIIAPRVSDLSLFHDRYPHSTGLLQPWTTLPAIIGVFCLLASALFFRRRQPVFAFATAWFFAGHALESSALPIELYFEHRNYLPILGYCLWVCSLLRVGSLKLARLAPVLIGFYVCLLSLLSFFSSSYWGNSGRLASVWGAENATSVRAAYNLLQYHLATGDSAAVEKEMLSMRQKWPSLVSLELFDILISQCSRGEYSDKQKGELLTSIANAQFDMGVLNSMVQLTELVLSDKCPSFINHEYYFKMTEAYFSNPHYKDFTKGVGMLRYERARLLLDQGDIDEAIDELKLTVLLTNNFESMALIAKLHAVQGDFDSAFKVYNKLKDLTPKNLWAIKHKNMVADQTHAIILNIQKSKQESNNE